jgi:HJR/Mrr/RecB family endonuclease
VGVCGKGQGVEAALCVCVCVCVCACVFDALHIYNIITLRVHHIARLMHCAYHVNHIARFGADLIFTVLHAQRCAVKKKKSRAFVSIGAIQCV